jgi:hypothetical protein
MIILTNQTGAANFKFGNTKLFILVVEFRTTDIKVSNNYLPEATQIDLYSGIPITKIVDLQTLYTYPLYVS